MRLNIRWLNLRSAPVSAQSIVPAVLFLSLIAVGFSSKPNWGVSPQPRVWSKFNVPKDQAFIGSIDSPMLAQAGGYMQIFGWAAATAKTVRVTKIEVFVDRDLAGTIDEFIPRPDVAAAFGRPDFEYSGWRQVVSTQRLSVGDHKLRLQVFGSDGSSAVLFTKKLTILE